MTLDPPSVTRPGRLSRLLRSEVLRDPRLLVFEFMMGTILSVPLGGLLQFWLPHEMPEWVGVVYFAALGCSLLFLPLWSYSRLRPWPRLSKIGVRIGLVIYALLLVSLLFPGL